MRARILAWQGIAFVTATLGGAQTRPDGVTPDSVTVVADSAFAREGWGRWLLGDTYRELWTAPVRVEVLDLGRFAGGLTPLELGGRLQTRSIRFQGADGHQYQFRLVQKHLNPLRWKGFEGSLAGDLVQDQLSALHPTGALVIPVLLEAAGVPHIRPLLRVMPDDARLGEFRQEFANQLGMLEMRVDGTQVGAALMCAVRVEDTEDLLEALRKDPGVRVDTRTFLAVRLIDLMIGDWDRHEDQYHWALVKSGGVLRWRPIPRDRDYAFSSYDGAAADLGRKFAANMPVYEEAHGPPAKAAGLGRPLDRRLLNDLAWPAWDSVARRLQASLTDSVISRAVADLPPEHERLDGAELRRVLRSRRDSLLPAARRFYEYLTPVVRIDAGDTDDWMDVERSPDGRTVVRLGRTGERSPYYERVFESNETREIRIFLRDGADRARFRGEGPGPVVRVVGGAGADTLADQSRPPARLYDEDTYSVPNGERVDGRPYVSPDSTPETPSVPDWGAGISPRPRMEHSAHSGLVVGLELRRTGYAFRTHPYATRSYVSLDYSVGRSAVRVRGGTRWHRENSELYYGVSGLASGIEGGRFFGFGNATTYAGSADEFNVHRRAFELSPFVGIGLESRLRMWLMLRARHTVTDLNEPTNQLSQIRLLSPPGLGDVGKFGPAVRFELDTRNTEMATTAGVHARVDAEYNPLTWSNGSGSFGSVEGLLATYFAPISREWVGVSLRGGGRKVWGDFPYFESAFLGGSRSLRGYPTGRFAGDQSLYGNAELRVKALDNHLILPLEVGVLGFADAGRMWFKGESIGSWHTDAGAGIWLSILNRSEGLTFGFARGDEGQRLWLTIGMPF
jgi:hypothetical protein